MLAISSDHLARMHAHLEAGYPHEACGILIGEIEFPSSGEPIKRVREVVLVDNIWTPEDTLGGTQSGHVESQRNRYLISPEDIARADRDAGKRGLDIIGFFHSHPDHPSRPSETDREFAWPVISFVITSVCDRKAAMTQSWVLQDDPGMFEEEEIRLSA
jgi:proteasome lid subunit RPN8/RPN11